MAAYVCRTRLLNSEIPKYNVTVCCPPFVWSRMKAVFSGTRHWSSSLNADAAS